MALAPARQAGGRAARIADFWRISAVFWLHTGIRIPWGADRKTRAFVRGSWPAGCRITARCRRDLTAGCRIEGRGSRPAGHGSRITVAGSRLPDRCPLPTRFARRIMASRLPDRGARPADHGARFAGWYVWGNGRGARRGFINSFNGAMLAGDGH